MVDVSVGPSSPPYPATVIIEWMGSPHADLVADSMVSIVQQCLSAPNLILTLRNRQLKRPTSNESLASVDDSAALAKKGGTTKQEEEILKRMRLGLLDPSRALSDEARNLLGISENAQDGDTVIGVERLRKIGDLLRQDGRFAAVSLNADKDRLLVRGHQGEEAFLCIIFGSGELRDGRSSESSHRIGSNHQAILKCEDTVFSSQVAEALRNIT